MPTFQTSDGITLHYTDEGAGLPILCLSGLTRNGTDFGIRISGLGDDWFTGPADVPDGLYFSGFTFEDANPDIGDSTIILPHLRHSYHRHPVVEDWRLLRYETKKKIKYERAALLGM